MTLIKTTRIASTLALVFAAGITSATTDASAAACRARVSGEGTGIGVAGAGTRKAKEAAFADWSEKARAKYGDRYAKQSSARGVRYDCKGGVVLEAKCVMSALPCR